MAFGAHAELSKVDINSNFNNSGAFTFNANQTNYALVSFLLGYIYTFNQGSGQYLNDRNQFYGFYAQDSWRDTDKLTLNYGVRYEPFLPWAEINHKLMQFNPTAYASGRVSRFTRSRLRDCFSRETPGCRNKVFSQTSRM